MKKNLLLVIIVVFFFSFISCKETGNYSEGSIEEPLSSVESSLGTLKISDRAGNEIEVPKNINRIISMAPSTTEILIDLGLGDKLVAIDQNAKGIKGLKEGIPQFDMMSPDIEKLANLKPDIVFTSGMSNLEGAAEPYKPLRGLGVCVADIPTSSSIKDIKEDIIFIANLTGKSKEGSKMVENLDSEIEKVALIGGNIKEKKTVYFEIAAAPSMYSFGSGVFLNELIELVGAINVFSDRESWMSVNDEAVVLTNPDVILTNVNYIQEPVNEIKSRKGWENIKAVKNNEVYYIDNNASSLPNHNIVKVMKEIAKAVYPDKY
ncbi:MAG: ABC transporter substrate-binding protein [Clostridiaceae bacterium]|jgi:iron complex transport system substrate-binding protein|nr:ABC transporter substrate-binding protein [Clostridiaceae bacterium]